MILQIRSITVGNDDAALFVPGRPRMQWNGSAIDWLAYRFECNGLHWFDAGLDRC
jgi:hypothetical protein